MYAIALTNDLGQPQPLPRDTPYLGLGRNPESRATLRVPAPLRDASRFGMAPDAACFLEGNLLDPRFFAVVGLLPWAEEEARAAAEHAWNHRNCRPVSA